MTEKLPNQPPEQFDPPTGADYEIPDFIDPAPHEEAAAARTVDNSAKLAELQAMADDWSNRGGPGRERRVLVDVAKGPDAPSSVSSSPRSPFVPKEVDPQAEGRLAAARAARKEAADEEAYLTFLQTDTNQKPVDKGDTDEQ